MLRSIFPNLNLGEYAQSLHHYHHHHQINQILNLYLGSYSSQPSDFHQIHQMSIMSPSNPAAPRGPTWLTSSPARPIGSHPRLDPGAPCGHGGGHGNSIRLKAAGANLD